MSTKENDRMVAEALFKFPNGGERPQRGVHRWMHIWHPLNGALDDDAMETEAWATLVQFDERTN